MTDINKKKIGFFVGSTALGAVGLLIDVQFARDWILPTFTLIFFLIPSILQIVEIDELLKCDETKNEMPDIKKTKIGFLIGSIALGAFGFLIAARFYGYLIPILTPVFFFTPTVLKIVEIAELLKRDKEDS
ncbi:MAG: hypothetical protein PUB39_01040 [Eubacteriales bacterium]|nr:hypothetical protein [Eubacteriales bacterium]